MADIAATIDTDYPDILWEEVGVGDALPELRLPITWKTIVMGAAGTRDFMPYHHHPTQPIELGMRGPFINTMFFQGLFSRFATDWSGPGSAVASLVLRMSNQLIPGDTAVVSGVVTAKSEGDATVVLDLRLENDLGPVAAAVVTLAMPSTEGEQVVPPPLELGELAEPDAAMPGPAREWYGREYTRRSVYPISEAQIGYWIEAVQDANPLYRPTDYAARSPFGGMIAPSVSLMTWVMPRATQTGVAMSHPDVDLPEQAPWPGPLWPGDGEGSASFLIRMPGVTQSIVQQIALECGNPYRPGDEATVTSALIGCSEKKETRLGPGYFVTFQETYRNQKGEVAGRITITILQYGIES